MVPYQGSVNSYSDGSLGQAGRAFRDGVFSQADPLSPYGANLLQAYSDGSLGTVPSYYSCLTACVRSTPPEGRAACMRGCAKMSRRKKKMAASGLGMTASTKGALITVGVLAAILVAMPVLGSRKRK